ncbi:MAG: transposase [Anaerolineae bacterium]
MYPIEMRRFMGLLFDDQAIAERAAEIGQAILKARSLRLTEIATQMPGTSAAAYKRLHRFLQRDDPEADPRRVLWRLLSDQAEFVIADPTEIERPQARATEYVGILKDGKTRGFWALVLAVPYRGRAIPCGLITYSSRTIAEEGDSRNRNHFRAFAALKDLLGERPLVLDREFSYLELMRQLVAEGIHFVIRLNLGSHPPKFLDSEGREVSLEILPGETIIYRDVLYKGQIRVNLIGIWRKGFLEPLWVMTDLEPEEGLRIYLKRMKIDEMFRDGKSLLGMGRLMNKRWVYMEKMLALLFIVYAVAYLIGERLRDFLYGEPIREKGGVSEEERIPGNPQWKQGKKWKRYSGLFVLLRQRWSLSLQNWERIVEDAWSVFAAIVLPVPTHV